MSRTNSEQLRQICNDVWRERAIILTDCNGVLTGESALIRAVYWRLCKAGAEPDQRIAETPLLKELVRQYRDETSQSRSQ
jgi:hypothetical protein